MPVLPFLVAGLILSCLMPAAAASRPLYRSPAPTSARGTATRGQSGGLLVRATAHTGATLKATTTFSPRRLGRPVVFQVKTGSGWRRVAAGRESALGVAVFRVPTTSPGKFTYRAVTLAFHGMAAFATPQRLVTIVDSGKTTRASVADSTGAQSNSSGTDDEQNPAISGNGRFVAFESTASNFVSVDTAGRSEIFLRDRQTGHTTLVSAATDGTPGNGPSLGPPAISADGRYIAYLTSATNIVPGAFPFGGGGVLVWDRQTDQTIRADLGLGGTPANDSPFYPAISANGRYIAYWSQATNLTPAGKPGLFLFDRAAHTTTQIAVTPIAAGLDNDPTLSGDGRYVTYASWDSHLVPGDTNGQEDVFVWDRATGTTRRVSVSATHQQANGASSFPSISANGRYIAYWSNASNLGGPATCCDRLLMWNHKTGTTSMIFPPGLGHLTAISADGSHVAFIDPNNEIVVWDRATRRSRRVSVSPKGRAANGQCWFPAISADGRYVAFSSIASNLVHGDTNNGWDVFVRDRFAG